MKKSVISSRYNNAAAVGDNNVPFVDTPPFDCILWSMILRHQQFGDINRIMRLLFNDDDAINGLFGYFRNILFCG